MRVKIFCASEEDRYLYMKYKPETLDYEFTAETLTDENAELARGMDAIVIQTRCIITTKLAGMLKDMGVKEILTRSVGYDHMDLKAMRQVGLKGANVAVYSPNAIAEYTCTVAMMLLRRMPAQMTKIGKGDFTLAGIRGREIRKLTIGVVGAGRIGLETIKIMAGFGGEVLVYDVRQNEEISQIATYVSIDDLYEKSDVIIFHCPLLKENYHMVNKDTIARMKDGVVLINSARGGLWDYEDVCSALKVKKISAAGFDVFEGEDKYLRKNVETSEIPKVLKELLSMDNVIYTAHSAFYTDVAIENMIEVTTENLTDYEKGIKCRNELIGDDQK